MIHVILGIPTSGKSMELIKLYEQYNKQKEIFITERVVYSEDIEYKVISRLRSEGIDAKKIISVDDIKNNTDRDTAVFIDEIENLKGEYAEALYELSRSRDVFLTATSTDSDGVAYSDVGKLLCYADSITHLKAVCDICNTFSATKYMIIEAGSKYLKLCPVCNKE